MPISVTCPGCDRGLKAPDTSAGRKIKCPKCGSAVPVPDADEETEELVSQKKKPVAAAKAAKSSRPRAEEEDERPRRRSRDEDDEEEDDEPRRGKKKRKAVVSGQPQMGMGLGSLGAGAVALVLGLLMWLTGNNLMAWIGVGLASVGLLLGIVGVIIAMQRKNKNVDLPRMGAAVNVLAILLCIALPIFASRTDPPVKQAVQEDKKKPRLPIQEPKAEQFVNQGAPQTSQGTAQEFIQSKLKLSQLAKGMHDYHDAHMKFPKAAITSKDGKPLLSWRVAILPYIEQTNLYQQFKLDEPWDSEHNKKLIDNIPELFRPVRADPGGGKTYYQVFTGKLGPFGQGRQPKLISFTDGTSNTFLIAEGHRAVIWTQPDDMEYDGDHKFKDGEPITKIGGMFSNAFCAALADSTSHHYERSVSAAQIHAMITASGGETIPLPK